MAAKARATLPDARAFSSEVAAGSREEPKVRVSEYAIK
jgi:hypothetical protein